MLNLIRDDITRLCQLSDGCLLLKGSLDEAATCPVFARVTLTSHCPAPPTRAYLDARLGHEGSRRLGSGWVQGHEMNTQARGSLRHHTAQLSSPEDTNATL